MSVVIRLAHLGDEPSPYDDTFVKEYDPDKPGKDPDGVPMLATVESVKEAKDARKFATQNEALDFYYRVAAPPYDVREDGKPNRPMTAFTIELVQIEDEEGGTPVEDEKKRDEDTDAEKPEAPAETGEGGAASAEDQGEAKDAEKTTES